ncbi:retrovirus-related pol polyprotein from transposon TNT 1-94, partial [Tanacetum coccineum]
SETPQQNDVVERRNRTLIEAARTMLIFSKALMFLWAEVVATAYYTQNRSLIHNRNHKTPYELVHDKKPDLTFFQVFGALCYPTNDSEDLGKLQPITNIGIFVGYVPSRKGYIIYNKRTRQIMETIHIQFDELSELMAPVQLSIGPAPTFLTHGQISSRLVPNPVPAAPYVPPTNKELEILFQLMFDEYLEPPHIERPVSPAPAVPVPVNSAGTPSSTTIDQDSPSPSHSLSSLALQSPSFQQGFVAESTSMEDNLLAYVDNDPFINVFAPKPSSEASSSGDVSSAESTYVIQTHHHLRKWSKDHPLDNVICNPSRPNFKSANIVRDSPSPADAETGARSDMKSSKGDTKIVQITEELGEDVEKQENVEEKMVELDQDQAGSDPGETLESRPQPEQVYMEEDQARLELGIGRVALAGPDPEPTHDEFMADLYLKVQESLKFPADEHVILEDPLRSTETLSSIKNLEDAYAIGDQFIIDKSTVDKPGKLNVEAEVVSMVIVPIYQASSFVPPLSTPVIDLSPPKPTSSTTQTPIFTTKTTITTTPLPPPLQQQSTTESEVYILELGDLPHKIDEEVRENVKEAVQIALQAPLRDRFRDLSEEDMKEMLHQRMFETGSYKSLPVHIALYESLEESMERAQRDEFLAEKDKSCKRHRDNQDPPPPPPISVRGDDMTLALLVHHSLKLSEQPVEDIPIPDSANISDSEDTDSAHLPKIKQRPEWLKPIPDDERPTTPELAWVIPTSHIPDAENNWSNALASTYQAPAKNSLLEKTGDMRTFMNWYCQKMGKTDLTQADLEGQAYEVVKHFYPDVVHLQFQMEECHKMLIEQIDWANPEGDQVRIDISKPLPLSGPPGHALSISKMKAARYHDFGLKLLVPEHMWIDDVCTYDISASYGISHWCFNCQKLYIDRHTVESSRKVVRTHMRILSVVRIKAYSRYGYNYLKKIILRRADHQEYTIAKKDFENLYPSKFEDLNLLLLQGHLNHLPGSDMLVFPVSNNERKIMRFNEIYKFSDGTLTNIMEAPDYKVKEYKVDIEKVAVRSSLRSLKPKCTIESRAKKSSINLIRILFHITCSSHNVKTRIIIRVLCIILVVILEHLSDTYVFTMKMKILLDPTSSKLMVGKLGDSDVYTLEDLTLILEILSRRFFIRLNLPDHRLVLTGSGVKGTSRTTNNQAFTIKKGMSMPVQMLPAQDGKRPKVNDQRLDLADDLKEAQDHISSTITSHKTKITTSMYKISHEESKTMS